MSRLQAKVDYFRELLEKVTKPRLRRLLERLIRVYERIIERIDKKIAHLKKPIASAEVSFVVVEPLEILTTSLPDGAEGQPYSTQLEATGGLTPYSWACTSGDLATVGLSLDAETGEITGTPLFGAGGIHDFTFEVRDASAQAAQVSLGITIWAAPTADFTADPTYGEIPLEVHFSDASIGNITSWEWDFDNDGIIDSTDQNPPYIYDTVGKYTVRLRVTGPGGSGEEIKENLILTYIDTTYVDVATGDDTNDGSSPGQAVKTLQKALELAQNGCMVIVTDGIYSGPGNSDLDFAGKAIHLVSAGGPLKCIIDCSSRGFHYHSGEGPDTRVEGFTIRNGSEEFGGGILCENNSSPTIVNCIIRDNFANRGGGIYCVDSSPAITNCVVLNNRARDYGGGIYLQNSDSAITDCLIKGNSCTYPGGGIACLAYSDATIVNCTITENSASRGAGIIINQLSKPTIENCTVTNNSATDMGGGIVCAHADVSIINCMISGNKAPNDAGGILCGGAVPTIVGCTIKYNSVGGNGGGVFCNGAGNAIMVNCSITDNSADGGGGVYVRNSQPTATNCTIANNAAQTGGGIRCDWNSDPVFNNTVLWGNKASGSGNQIYTNSTYPSVTLNYCNYARSTGDIEGPGTVTPNNCMSKYPAFVDGPRGDYHIQIGSPCIDSGLNSLVPSGILTDLDGNPRIVNGDDDLEEWNGQKESVDIGAYEYQGTIYVDGINGDDTKSGLSWAEAVQTIQTGLGKAGTGWTVIAANGTYTGADNKNLDFNGKAIHLKSAGGAAKCIIDCENDGRGFYFHTGEITRSIINGFTIRNGRVSGTSGGGIHCLSASPAILNCVIENCETIRSAHLGGHGGGIFVCCRNANPTIVNCVVRNNTASGPPEKGWGGGIYCGSWSRPTIVGCVVANNFANDKGGGFYFNQHTTPTVTNCTVANNSADYGGGIRCSYRSIPTVNNTILWRNTAGISGSQIHANLESAVTLSYCDLPDNVYDPNRFGGDGSVEEDENCIHSNPAFVASGSPGPSGGGDYHLQSDSPCIDKGNDALLPVGITVDADGCLRVVDGDYDSVAKVDIGAYEYPHVAPPVASFAAAPTSGVAPFTVYFTDSSTGDITSWAWDFDGDGVVDSTLQHSSYAYQNPGVFTVTLIVTGPGGSGSETKTDHIAAYDGSVYISVSGSDRNKGTSWDEPLATIQKGIDIAEVGWTVLVGDGTYRETDIDLGGKAITLRSQSGATSCIIDCNFTGRGFYFHSGETRESILDGFTIQNGYAQDGGAILCENNSTPTITDCIVTSNQAEHGGGVCCLNSSPWITNCVIAGNSAVHDGAGIRCVESSPMVTNCTIADNSANGSGGAVFCHVSSRPSFYNTIFWGNTALTNGNQICVHDAASRIMLANCSLPDEYEDPNRYGGSGGVDDHEACIFTNPQFVDAQNGNYRLQSISLCIDAGDSYCLGLIGVMEDVDGNVRTVWEAVDIGAYEYQVCPAPLTYVSETVQPNSVLPGSTKAFSVRVKNLTYEPVILSTGTVLRFDDSPAGGGHVFLANLAEELTIGSGEGAELIFQAAEIDQGFLRGSYSPVIMARGSEAFDITVTDTVTVVPYLLIIDASNSPYRVRGDCEFLDFTVEVGGTIVFMGSSNRQVVKARDIRNKERFGLTSGTEVEIIGRNMTIFNTGTIDFKGMGHDPGQGPVTTGGKTGAGKDGSFWECGGGGGASNVANGKDAPDARPEFDFGKGGTKHLDYDTPENRMGSGGGGLVGAWSGEGGGSVIIKLFNGTLTNDGIIDVSGNDGWGDTAITECGTGGGGAGTIMIWANNLAGAATGKFIARGGKGGVAPHAGGNGADGRIRIRWCTANNFAGTFDVIDKDKYVKKADKVNVTVNCTPVGKGILLFADDETVFDSKVFQWCKEWEHTIGTTTPQEPVPGRIHTFISWSADGVITHAITQTVVVEKDITYTAAFDTWYRLKVFSDPGTVDPPVGEHWIPEDMEMWCSADTPTEKDGVRYECTGWAGTGSVPQVGNTNAVMFVIKAPSSITWNWQATDCSLTVSSDHAKDTCQPAADETHWYPVGKPVTCRVAEYTAEQDGERYRCTGWIGTGSVPMTGDTNSIPIIMEIGSTITWQWKKRYKLTTSVNPPEGGTVSPAAGLEHWYNAPEEQEPVEVEVKATANTGYIFVGWSGDLSGMVNPQILKMYSPKKVTANFIGTPEIDGFVNGEDARGIPSMVEHSADADTDNDARVITGGYVLFKASVSGAIELLKYEWSVSKGSIETDNTRRDVKWDAPKEESEVVLTLKIKSVTGVVIITKTAKIYPVRPRIIRVKFVDDDSGNNEFTLRDHVKNANIAPPQFDRLETSWEQNSKEYRPDDFKNDKGARYKNESAAYKRGTNLRVQADVAATDEPDAGHTPTKHKDLSADTPIRLVLTAESPSLTFKNKKSGAAEGKEFDASDWSDKDYDSNTDFVTFTSNENVGDTIKFYWETKLKWAFRVKDKNGNWVDSRKASDKWETVHRSLCVVDRKPVKPPYLSKDASEIPWEKVVQFSCDWAKGKTGGAGAADQAVVDAIWDGLDSNLADGGAKVDLDYDLVATMQRWDTRELMDLGKGSCGCWVVFFADLCGSQGISVDVHTVQLQRQTIPNNAILGWGFAVDDKDIDGDEGQTDIGGVKHWSYGNPLIVNADGNHSFNMYGTTVYDPSFDKKVTSTTWDKYFTQGVDYFGCSRWDAANNRWQHGWVLKGNIGNAWIRGLHLKNYQLEAAFSWKPYP